MSIEEGAAREPSAGGPVTETLILPVRRADRVAADARPDKDRWEMFR